MRLLKFVTWVILVAALLSPMAVRPGSADIPPNPIDPKKGHATLLDLINSLPLNDIESALDNFPVPYVVIASADGADPTIENHHAGAPTRVNADRSKATGKGGKDIKVEVNTELHPTPHLVLTIDRIGDAPFAEDLEVLIAFPFDAFNDEILPGAPNLFIGYQTTGEFDGTGYPPGGHAPSSVEIVFTPDILGGAEHTFELEMNTTGADNPIRFIVGHFDGDAAVGILNATAISAHTDPVPANIAIALDVSSSAILPGGLTDSLVDISWNASEPSKVVFDYLENEDFPFTTPDYNTTLTFDLMPTSEVLSLSLDVAAGTFTLAHTASDVIDEITLLHEREDGLMIVGTASDVPTEVALTLGLSGSVILDVNDNTLDLQLLAIQDGGFPGTDDFFGYDLGYLSVVFEDVPDLEAEYVGAEDSFTVQATNPGESIGKMELVIGDDDSLELPPDWEAVPAHHIFSLMDDGTHGTAAARVLHLRQATLDLDAAVAESYELTTGEADPMHAYLRTTPTSNVIPGHDIEATCDIDVIPAGEIDFDVDFPPPGFNFEYTIDPPQGIEEVHCFGHVDTLNFDLLAGDLPPVFKFEFDPDSHLTVTAENGSGPNSDSVGRLAIRLWDETGPGLPETSGLLGIPLRDARARVDESPSFQGTWSDAAAGTSIGFDTGIPDALLFLDGAQVAVSTEVGLPPLLAAAPTSDHYARFTDEGGTGLKQLAAGVFGIDEFSYSSDDATRELELRYGANEDHRLVVDIDSTFDGRFFPDYDIAANLTIDDVPQTWVFTTNLATALDYMASDGIDEVSLTADIGIRNPDLSVDTTHIEGLITGLPSTVHYLLVPEAEGRVELMMNNPIAHVMLELTSDTSILGEPYRHILIDVQDIPDDWSGEWGPAPDPHASLTANQPLGTASLVISRDIAANTPSKYDIFEVAGGVVEYTPFAREVDRRYFRLGEGDDAVREVVFMSRLDGLHGMGGLYGTSTKLDPGEDHVIYRENADGDLDFLSIQGTGFQGLYAQRSGDTYWAGVDIPVAGAHPFYVGMESPVGTFLTVQVEDLPDETDLVVGPTVANIDFSASPGDIVVYKGPLPMAYDGQDALKLVISDTPRYVHASWVLDFPGAIAVDTYNPVEIAVLSQAGNDRMVADFVVGDLGASWGWDLGTTEEECELIPFPVCAVWLVIAEVYFDFVASPPIDGFVAVYERIGDVEDLEDPAGPPHNPAEYVPRLTILVDDFSHFNAEAQVKTCIVGLGICVPGAIVFDLDIDTDLLGNFNLDYWDLGGESEGDPDYVDNDPWDLVPLFHDQEDHVFPFGP